MSPFVDRQDYLWFLALCLWLLTLLGWFAVARRDTSKWWLLALAVHGVAVSAVLWLHQVWPMVLQESGPTWGAWEFGLSAGAAALGMFWAWHGSAGSARRVRVLPVGVTVALLAGIFLRLHDARSGNATVAVAVLISGCRLLWLCRGGLDRLSVIGALGALALAPNGIVAESIDLSLREVDLSGFGAVAAVAHGTAAALALVSIGRDACRELATAGAPKSRDCRALAAILGAWFAFGALLAEFAAWGARARFETDLVARCAMALALLDRAELGRTMGPELSADSPAPRLPRDYASAHNSAPSTWLAQHPPTALTSGLHTIERANFDIHWAYLVTIRDDWLIGCAYSPKLDHLGGRITYLTPLDPAARAAWQIDRPAIHEPADFYYGRFLRASAPVLDPAGGWLGALVFDLSVTQWVAAQAQARAQAFAIVGLGAVLLVSSWWQRRRSEQRLAAERRALEAEEANTIKTAFLAKVSHELRTPIQNVLGYAELLRTSRHASEDQTRLGALMAQGELLIRLVNDLIDLSAIESGLFRLDRRPVQLACLVEQVVESFRPRARARGLALEIEIDPHLPAWVEADPERLRQIIVNLMGNAVKFTNAGSIRVTAERDPGDPDRVSIQISDTGCGIPEDEMHRLFHPFSRTSSAAGVEGAGLGLALCRGLCERFGGSLRARGNPGGGTTFVADLRLPATAAARDDEPAAWAAPITGKRILIIDDNALVRELFVASLTERGASCSSAPDGGSGLQRATTESFDAVILDLALPDMPGTDVADRLRREHPDMLIVGVSAHAAAMERARALASGMDVFLTKPVALGQLAAAVAGRAEDGAPQESESDRRLRSRLAVRFREDAPQHSLRLQAAAARQDWCALRLAAHALQNSASVIQDTSLLRCASQLEAAARGATTDRIEAALSSCHLALQPWLSAQN